MKLLRIGTRGSPLALWQARAVAQQLTDRGAQVELVTISTHGDRRPESSLDSLGKAVFVKDIEDALLQSEVDLAVHSAKDMAAVQPDGLVIAATLPREDPRDALILPASTPTAGAVEAGRIGTSSPRRLAQLQGFMPNATFHGIRGNVETRLRKLDTGEFDALVLAAAGLRRLGLAHRISEPLPVDRCVPAPGQGIVAVQVRAGDEETYALVAAMHDEQSGQALTAEQAVVDELGGGCQLPLGAFAEADGRRLTVRAAVASLKQTRRLDCVMTGDAADPGAVGRKVATDLARRGALQLLES